MNVGGWFTAVTVIVKDFVEKFTFGAVFEPLSVRVALNVAVPTEFGADWNVKLPVIASMAGGVVKVRLPAGLVWVTVKPTRGWLLSLAGPGVIAVAKPVTVVGPIFSVACGLAPRLNVGGSLMKLTVMVNVCVLLLTLGATLEPLSVSVALNVAVPLVPGVGL